MRIGDWTLKTTLYTWHGKKIFQERSKEQIDEAGRQKGLVRGSTRRNGRFVKQL
jgi:hypothetical protein